MANTIYHYCSHSARSNFPRVSQEFALMADVLQDEMGQVSSLWHKKTLWIISVT